jgi:NADH:ubiquinone oxidoreductase subunit E
MNDEERTQIDEIIKSVRDPQSEKIRMLQLVQEKFGYLKDDYVIYLAEQIGTTFTDLYGVATFYSLFNLEPQGRHTVYVCSGTSCHVKGGKEIIDKLQELLGIGVKSTTEDGRFTLKSVRCIGCCGLAPVIMIDDQTFGRVKTTQIEGILKDFE